MSPATAAAFNVIVPSAYTTVPPSDKAPAPLSVITVPSALTILTVPASIGVNGAKYVVIPAPISWFDTTLLSYSGFVFPAPVASRIKSPAVVAPFVVPYLNSNIGNNCAAVLHLSYI